MAAFCSSTVEWHTTRSILAIHPLLHVVKLRVPKTLGVSHTTLLYTHTHILRVISTRTG